MKQLYIVRAHKYDHPDNIHTYYVDVDVDPIHGFETIAGRLQHEVGEWLTIISAELVPGTVVPIKHPFKY